LNQRQALHPPRDPEAVNGTEDVKALRVVVKDPELLAGHPFTSAPPDAGKKSSLRARRGASMLKQTCRTIARETRGEGFSRKPQFWRPSRACCQIGLACGGGTPRLIWAYEPTTQESACGSPRSPRREDRRQAPGDAHAGAAPRDCPARRAGAVADAPAGTVSPSLHRKEDHMSAVALVRLTVSIAPAMPRDGDRSA
jgi:hypothetical protein